MRPEILLKRVKVFVPSIIMFDLEGSVTWPATKNILLSWLDNEDHLVPENILVIYGEADKKYLVNRQDEIFKYRNFKIYFRGDRKVKEKIKKHLSTTRNFRSIDNPQELIDSISDKNIKLLFEYLFEKTIDKDHVDGILESNIKLKLDQIEQKQHNYTIVRLIVQSSRIFSSYGIIFPALVEAFSLLLESLEAKDKKTKQTVSINILKSYCVGGITSA